MTSIKIQQMLFERVVKEFGDENITMEELVARCSLTDIDMKNMKTPKTLPEEHQCCARIWDKDSDNTRCSKRRIDGKFFCAGHGRPMLNNTAGLEFVWQKCGRIDQPVPKDYRADKKIKITYSYRIDTKRFGHLRISNRCPPCESQLCAT